MDQKRAFLFLGFIILVWTVFWNVGLRVIAVRKSESPAARGLTIAV